MGWDSGPNDTPASIAASYVKGWDGMKCVKHTVTTEDDCRVLWAVMEYTEPKAEWPRNNWPVGHRWILCVLMRRERGSWGHKSMDESCGPYYYSCPLDFLDLTPAPSWAKWAADHSATWRAKVREYHGATIRPADLLAEFS